MCEQCGFTWQMLDFHMMTQLMLVHPLPPLLADKLPMVCTSKRFRWSSGKAVWFWYTLTMTQHWVGKDTIMMDAFKWPLQLGSNAQHPTGTWWGSHTSSQWMRGSVRLPVRRLDSSSNPYLLRTSAALLCTSGDLPLWTITTSWV